MIHFEIDLTLRPECGECLILLLQEIVLSMAISWQLYTTLATIRTKDESASAGTTTNIRTAWLCTVKSIYLYRCHTYVCVYICVRRAYINLRVHTSVRSARDFKCVDTSGRSFVKFSDLFIIPLPIMSYSICRVHLYCWWIADTSNDIRNFQSLYLQVYSKY